MIFNFPINKTSFGNVSYCILREFWKNKEDFQFFPIMGKMDLQDRPDAEFNNFLQQKAQDYIATYKKSQPSVKLWHIQGSHESLSDRRSLFTFHETDTITPMERNVLVNHEKVFVSSTYTKKVFEASGVENVVYCPLGLDEENFFIDQENFLRDLGIVSFGLQGKLEKRKAHIKVISAWIKKYGGDSKFRLNASIVNPFLVEGLEKVPPIDRKNYSVTYTKKLVAHKLQELGQELPWNVNFLPFEESNDLYNKTLNAQDICLGMSHCEGFNLPLFQSLCLGKQAVVFDAHVHKDYCDAENAFLVSPNSKMLDSNDGVFFKSGALMNQGSYQDWDEDDFLDACDKAVEKAFETNEGGVALRDKFTYGRTCEIIKGNLF